MTLAFFAATASAAAPLCFLGGMLLAAGQKRYNQPVGGKRRPKVRGQSTPRTTIELPLANPKYNVTGMKMTAEASL